MRCPICTQDHDKVVDSRTAQDGNIVRRRRKCLACGHKFTTYEAVERDPFYVIKKDQRRELYQRDKLLGGILTACKKRPVPMKSIELLVHTIEMDIRSGFQGEVPSWKIGELVINGLKQLDDVAYVRFASVYRQFKDAEEFIAELRKLKAEQHSKTRHPKRELSQKAKKSSKKEILPLFSDS
ncbi:transcriptional repressor NrdR [candidate division KSB3 bacterium]|uniref:Transcriptional repressor NrdR n=1 Tax=candidate division KSB3 bacterium TaxID=2044937 RepID=A0A9D5Q707_9BACT|nr:transcriptional repressor NrdR [candidate division KSB3 bacterium]MBD3326355.1 transcriptional repressor NrdR [candidate division KSB3 bacterium]